MEGKGNLLYVKAGILRFMSDLYVHILLVMWHYMDGKGIHINTKAMLQIRIDVEFVQSYLVWNN